eukprot:jgi/Tetstr1/442498/TSEL_030597.t1
MFTYAHVGMDDLLKKLPEHWRTAFMCLAAVCRHYLKADLAVYAKLGESKASRLGRITETTRAIDNSRGDGVANLKRFAKILGAKVVEEAFCEDGVNVHGHNAALFKQYVDEYAPDGMQMQHLRADTVNIK